MHPVAAMSSVFSFSANNPFFCSTFVPVSRSSSSSSPNTVLVFGSSINNDNHKKQFSSLCGTSTVVVRSGAKAEEGLELLEDEDDGRHPPPSDALRQLRKSADWKAARAYKESGVIYEGRVEGVNTGGLLIRFYSLMGFLPFPQLSPSHSCKEPQRPIQEIAKGLIGSFLSAKVIHVSEENRKLIFSERDAMWTKFSDQVTVGDIFEAKVGPVEDYGAFVHLCFPDGCYHLTGLVHVSEVSWDLVQDVRDVLNEGDNVRVKVIQIDREKTRITLSIKQLEDDPLLETLDKVIPQNGQTVSDVLSVDDSVNYEPLPGLEAICQELLKEEGITQVKIGRQGFEKRVVSQDLELWLSNVPAGNGQFTLLARAGRQGQKAMCWTLPSLGLGRVTHLG
ncbi:uncharacterized protein LOC18440065 isoform X2 [Amborella trichopoda]|uniref:uncharacterized protein LOC18440065 isoform X2 n=1 Tax=Amborella trichopoda TaxID=13333 RepID=UPI0009BC9D80|nr:uncharacterized protein LOC18440065 isoform X2 [Amborella trichopoda]|eukprot:XP_020526546.1 uncharacterized protein LOC18440065 isoform X2 [Amborella trichopoda]